MPSNCDNCTVVPCNHENCPFTEEAIDLAASKFCKPKEDGARRRKNQREHQVEIPIWMENICRVFDSEIQDLDPEILENGTVIFHFVRGNVFLNNQKIAVDINPDLFEKKSFKIHYRGGKVISFD